MSYIRGYIDGIGVTEARVVFPHDANWVAALQARESLVKKYNQLVDKYNSLLRDAKTIASFPTAYVFPPMLFDAPSVKAPSILRLDCETTRSVAGPDSALFQLNTSCSQQ